MVDPADIRELCCLRRSPRIESLKRKASGRRRVVSLQQALLVTESYRRSEGEPRVIRRARALVHVLDNIAIGIDPEEIVVGNRTLASRAGVVFPEAAVDWIDREIESLPSRAQDPFDVAAGDIRTFREEILPYWRGSTLADRVREALDDEIVRAKKVVKINQTDHAQGHIIPNVAKWLELGPAGIARQAKALLTGCQDEQKPFYESVVMVLTRAQGFIRRYGALAGEMADAARSDRERAELAEISRVCLKLVEAPPESFREAVQSVWFLFVLLQMESNASSFSPGRLDQYLMPYLARDRRRGELDLPGALEIVEALWLKFNQIVYMRNAESARYFAGFPIGFNVCVGGRTREGGDAANVLSYLCLKAQEHLLMPQPNFSVQLHEKSPQEFLGEVARVIGLGSGMPQVFNDESIIPALESQGVSEADAADYAVVGCVELASQGNFLGWSDAAMFNMVKLLELTLNDGRCMLTGEQVGPQTGCLSDFATFDELEKAYDAQMDYFVGVMMRACAIVDRKHAEALPSPFLSSVVDDCLARGLDVTSGGARYNLSGVQGIQVANVADNMAALKHYVFDTRQVEPNVLLDALRHDFAGSEALRLRLVKHIPKYGNDVAWVDELGAKWARVFAEKVARYTNVRGGRCHTGFYTVSAHVPMGRNVAATPDGRHARRPLADGGLSAMAGRDEHGPTALLKSVARIDSRCGSNGTLLNMKFLPEFFRGADDRARFAAMLRALVRLKIHHAQFNVIDSEDFVNARKDPESYGHLLVRVAGYTAYFTELAGDLQDEIIARTAFGG